MAWMDILDLAEFALSQFPENITLGEFKFLETTQEFITTRNDNVNNLSNTINRGFGIRILSNGSWGFAATNELSKAAVINMIKSAVSISNSSQRRSPNVVLTDEPVIVKKVSTDYKINPFKVPIEDKLDYLIDSAKIAKKYEEIKFVNGYYVAQKDDLILFSTEGTQIEQQIIWNGMGISMIASGSGDTQERSYPDDHFATQGWEYVSDFDLKGTIDEKAKELVALLDAPSMKAGKSSIILGPAQLGIQLHESCGHPSELDRSLGYEAAYAGTSFLKPELLEQNFNYGNELVNINADATIPGAIGSFPFDHEGVAGKNTPLVKNGKFVGFLTSRETAPLIGLEHSGGTMRAELFDKSPLIRMTNIVLQPGEWDFNEMIEDTKDGYYLTSNRSWSIDDLRYNFQFATQIGYRIEKGEITGLVKNPTYTGITDEFWNNVSAVANKEHMKILGTPFCGKGEPGQSMYTGHGGAPTRFENVRIGVL
ncbi:MAG: hypothetical protein HeimC2_35860 [Candidatus Heimdallarchaeota archaeon LC_2]|nr:MAG: hypothetical protein HeimC2_35860 [Candidatus Heimdallarchaeota archaeon LC_2]